VFHGIRSLTQCCDFLIEKKIWNYECELFIELFEEIWNRFIYSHKHIEDYIFNNIYSSNEDVNKYFDTTILQERLWTSIYNDYIRYIGKVSVKSKPSPTESNQFSDIIELETIEEPMDILPNPKYKLTEPLINVFNTISNKGFSNTMGITCFIDSILTPLLCIPNMYIQNVLLSSPANIPKKHKMKYKKYDECFTLLQDELLTLQQLLFIDNEDEISVLSIIHMLASCNDVYREFFNKSFIENGGDDAEFLQLLLEFFYTSPTKQVITIHENGKQRTNDQYVPILYLTNVKDVFTPDITFTSTGFILTEFNQSDLLIIKVSTKQEDIPYTIQHNRYIYTLEIITFHNNNHYTCNFKKNDIWYFYDGLSPKITTIKLFNKRKEFQQLA
jgi:hypothetical protein